MWHYGPWWGMMGYGWGWHMGVGAVFWLVFLVFAVMAMRAWAPSRRGEEPKSAVAILQERYARGEIGRDEFMEKSHDLAASGG